jgi:predicted nucleotide-binding protein
MNKEKLFPETRFSAEVLREALLSLKNVADQSETALDRNSLRIDHGDAFWTYDDPEEFFADYRRFNHYSLFEVAGYKLGISIKFSRRATTVDVRASSRIDVERIFDVFEKHASQSRLPEQPTEAMEKPIVFIGHGQSRNWRDLKDHLTDKHDIRVEAYESGARAGHSIRDVLEDMVKKSSFAVIVMTAEDEQADGEWRARQNVIHEAGLFQGRLGFPRAILLLEEGVESFSNVQGIQYIRFSKDNIKETFGEVLATLRREFPSDR